MSLKYREMVETAIREGFEPPSPAEFTRVDCSDLPSMTRQSEKDSCDINLIIKKFDRQSLAELAAVPAKFMDVSEVGTFRDVLDHVADATEYFGQLPAAVRSVFENDVALFMDRLTDPAWTSKLEELGVKKEGPADKPPTPPAQ